MGGRGEEGQSGGSFCSFFLSSSKGFSRLGDWGGDRRGHIGGEGSESPRSSATFKFLFSSIFHLLPGLHEFGICAGLILLTFSGSMWCPCSLVQWGMDAVDEERIHWLRSQPTVWLHISDTQLSSCILDPRLHHSESSMSTRDIWTALWFERKICYMFSFTYNKRNLNQNNYVTAVFTSQISQIVLFFKMA